VSATELNKRNENEETVFDTTRSQGGSTMSTKPFVYSLLAYLLFIPLTAVRIKHEAWSSA
jgi:hypothetical protein